MQRWPKDQKTSIYIPILKKGSTQNFTFRFQEIEMFTTWDKVYDRSTKEIEAQRDYTDHKVCFPDHGFFCMNRKDKKQGMG